MASEKVLQLSKDNFDETINSEVPVLVDFWATWCGPCRMLGPIIDQLGDELEGKVKIAKVNVDEQKELASRFQVMSIPTILIFKKGEMVEKMVGLRNKEALETTLNKHM
ncbi:MAG: thioredoxin [Deltaproteobacteria bacterium]